MITEQIARDVNVKTLVDDLNKAFETMREAEDLQTRCADPKQAEIIVRICQQSSECGSFITLYFNSSSFCTPSDFLRIQYV